MKRVAKTATKSRVVGATMGLLALLPSSLSTPLPSPRPYSPAALPIPYLSHAAYWDFFAFPILPPKKINIELRIMRREM